MGCRSGLRFVAARGVCHLVGAFVNEMTIRADLMPNNS